VQLQIIVSVLAGLWLLGLSAGLFWIYKVINRLTKDVKGETLIKVLENVLAQVAKNAEDITGLKKEIANIRELDRYHVQKIGVVRFNPFKETGGDHSFSIAFLDETDTGVVFTGIHTRERTRIYTKAIKCGKGEFELSEEEKKALVKAQRK